jgi:hypothetical protein
MNRISATLLGLAALAAPALAQAAPNMSAGLWEITTKSEMPGMPMQMPPTTFRHCYKAEDLKQTKETLPVDKNCKFDDLKESGNSVRWKVSCKTESGPMSGSGEVTYAGQSYTGNMTLIGKVEGMDINMKQSYTAKRVGDCK